MALDLGKPGKDNIYGAGRVNAYDAVRAVLNVPFIYVPDDYETIQEAINNASKRWWCDNIRDEVYYENLIINKRITLKSKNGSAKYYWRNRIESCNCNLKLIELWLKYLQSKILPMWVLIYIKIYK